MLIYHKTDGELYCTQINLGFGVADISTTKKDISWVPESHKDLVKGLQNNKDILVIGGTYASAIYKGKYEPRENFLNYLVH